MFTRKIPALAAAATLAFTLAACGGEAESEPTLADLELEQARWESQERESFCTSFEAATPGSHELSHSFKQSGEGNVTAESIRMATDGANRTKPYSCSEPLFEIVFEDHLETHFDESPLGKAGVAYGVG